MFIATVTFSETFGQAVPWYQPTPSHAAWSTGASFNNGSEFTRGFCFAWDGVSPIGQGGQATIYKRNVEVGGPNHPITLQITYVYLPNTSTLYAGAQGVKEYANSLTNLNDKNFWLGYAHLLEMAFYNPSILLLTPGSSV